VRLVLAVGKRFCSRISSMQRSQPHPIYVCFTPPPAVQEVSPNQQRLQPPTQSLHYCIVSCSPLPLIRASALPQLPAAIALIYVPQHAAAPLAPVRLPASMPLTATTTCLPRLLSLLHLIQCNFTSSIC
jgi:hypothetical protein